VARERTGPYPHPVVSAPLTEVTEWPSPALAPCQSGANGGAVAAGLLPSVAAGAVGRLAEIGRCQLGVRVRAPLRLIAGVLEPRGVEWSGALVGSAYLRVHGRFTGGLPERVGGLLTGLPVPRCQLVFCNRSAGEEQGRILLAALVCSYTQGRRR
jgi:hypothetical protein